MQAAAAVLLFSLSVNGATPNLLHVRKPYPPPVAVIGKPYSGQMRIEVRGARPDGTRIVNVAIEPMQYRDSQGRTRRDSPYFDSKNALRIVTIDDPSANVEYVLEPAKKIAHRFTFTPGAAKPKYVGPVIERPVTSTQTESLGQQDIDGLSAEGMREIRTIDDTARFPDKPPRVTITDRWTSTDLQVEIQVTSAEMQGETVSRMINLRREEPPAALFQVPADYRMEDELGDFVIEYPFRGRTAFPEPIRRVTAKYTGAALNAGLQGVVLVALTVDESGRPRNVHVAQPLDPGLDQEAVKAVSQWRFRPGTEDGHNISTTVNVEVTFGIN